MVFVIDTVLNSLYRLFGMGWRWRARYARAKGHYNRQTRKYFWRAWHYSKRPDDALAYALFKRDLGENSPLYLWRELRQSKQTLRVSRRFLADAVVLASSGQCSHATVPAIKALEHLQLPAALYGYQRYLGLSPQQTKLLKVFQNQSAWRQQLADALKKQTHHGKGICVVGNAAGLAHSHLGQMIDQYAMVVRFNRFSSENTRTDDMGNQLDTWVLTPNFVVNTATQSIKPKWVILTGPAMEYRLLNWSGLMPLVVSDTPIITIPLSVWRKLVRDLEAPPSAGLVLLYFFYELLGSWQGISVAGFGALIPQTTQNRETAYHHTNTQHPAATRHNWQREALVLQQWLTQGLHSLHAEQTAE